MHLITSRVENCTEVYETRITDLDLLMMSLTNGCYNDDIIQLGSFRSQSLCRLVQISDVRFVHLLLQYFPHNVINWIQIWQI